MRTTTLRCIGWARCLVVTTLALAMCWMTTDVASAAPPFAASGTWVPTGGGIEIIPNPSKSVVFFDQAAEDNVSGTLDGTLEFHASCQVRVASLQGVCEGTDKF